MALTPSPARSSFKDPRETGEAANQRLSSYFEGKAENKPAFSYSTGGGEAPASGGTAPAPSGPKAPTSTGGSGFVNFGQYFGANAPAVQETVAKNIDAASSTKAMRAPQGAPGLSTFGTVDFGKTPSASTMAQRQAAGPSAGAGYDRAIAQTQEQMAGVSPYTQPGSYGTGTAAPSAFDAMLGGGLQQREAKTRFGELEKQLGAQREAKSEFQRKQDRLSKAERSRADAARRQQEAADRDAADLAKAKDIAYNKVAGWVERLGHSPESYWNSLSEEQKQAVLNGVAQKQGQNQYGPEYASASQ